MIEVLSAIATEAKKQKDAPDFVQARILQIKNRVIDVTEAPNTMHDELLDLRKEKWLPEAERALIEGYFLLFYADILYPTTNKEHEKEVPIKKNAQTNKDLRLWGKEDIAQAIDESLDILKKNASAWINCNATHYSHIVTLGKASEEVKHSIALPLIEMLSTLFNPLTEKLYSLQYDLHPLSYVFSKDEMLLPAATLRPSVGEVLSRGQHIVAKFIDICLELEEKSPLNMALMLHDIRTKNFYFSIDRNTHQQLLFNQQLIDRYSKEIKGSFFISSLYADQVRLLYEENQPKEALTLAQKVLKSDIHPYARNQIKRSIQNIERPTLSAQLKSNVLWSKKGTSLELTHKNIASVSIAVYNVGQEVIRDQSLRSSEKEKHSPLLYNKSIQQLLPKVGAEYKIPGDWKAVFAKDFSLTESKPYLDNNTELPIPSLPEGVYILQIQAAGASSKTLAFYSCDSRLLSAGLEIKSLLLTLNKEDGKYLSEHPLYKKRFGSVEFEPIGVTDKEGMLELSKDKLGNHYEIFIATSSAEPRIFVPVNSFARPSHYYVSPAHNTICLFTDRAIYRPGQKLFFKGILAEANDNKETCSIIADRSIRLTYIPANGGKEVEIGTYTTNAYGAFNGTLDLPENIMGGAFTLKASLDKEGFTTYHSVQIDEYKRGDFYAEIDTQVTTNLLYGDPISPKVKVNYFTGSPVSGAKISYRLLAAVQHDFWYPYDQQEYTITEGEGVTNNQGEFSPEDLKLKLDSEQLKRLEQNNNRPINKLSLQYRFIATVTSPSGETHQQETIYYSGKSIVSLSSSLQATNVKENLHEWRVVAFSENSRQSLSNLHGQYRIYKINKGKPTKLPAIEGAFTTDESIDAHALRTLPSGEYLIRFHLSSEKYQIKGVEDSVFYLISAQDKKVHSPTALFSEPLDKDFRKGKPIAILLSSNQKNQDIYLSVSARGKQLSMQCLTIDNEVRAYHIEPICEDLSAIAVDIFALREDDFINYHFVLPRKKEKPTPSLRVEGLKDKYRPGEEVHLRLSLTDSTGKGYPAEIALWAYDTSLDQLLPYHMPSMAKTDANLGGCYFISSTGRALWSYLDFPYEAIPPVESPQWDHVDALSLPMLVNMYGHLAPARPCRTAASNESTNKIETVSAPMVMAAMEDTASDNTKQEKSIAPKATPNASIRSDFRETAVWMPGITFDKNGRAEISFRLPERLTSYSIKFFAHDKEADSYALEEITTVSAPVSIVPNMPRFIRVGDHASIPISIISNDLKACNALLYMELFDPISKTIIHREEKELSLVSDSLATVSFDIPTQSVASLLGCRINIQTPEYNDAAEYMLSVLPISKPIIEAVPITAYAGKKTIVDLSELFNHHDEKAQQKVLTLELNANPLWGAIESLPLALEDDGNDAYSTAYKLTCNALSRRIAQDNPEFMELLRLRKMNLAASAQSPLTTNEELRILPVELSAYYRQASADNIEKLFYLLDSSALDKMEAKSIATLKSLQNADGGFSWYAGMNSNYYTTTTTLYLFARLPEGSVKECLSPCINRAMDYLLTQWDEQYEKDSELFLQSYALDMLYLGATFRANLFSRPNNMTKEVLKRIEKEMKTLSLYQLTMATDAFFKIGQRKIADSGYKRLKGFLLEDRNLGLTIVRSALRPYNNWLDATIPTHCHMMDLTAKLEPHSPARESMKLWLLNQKRASNWGNSIVNAYALLTLFSSETKLMDYQGAAAIQIDSLQYSTSTDLQTHHGATPFLKKVIPMAKYQELPSQAIVTKEGKGMAWGAVYATYQLPANQLQEVGNQDLAIQRQLFVVRRNKEGQERAIPLHEDKNPLKKGDKIVVELTITAGREYNFLTIRDMKSPSVEVDDKLSGIRYSNRLYYYYEPKDSEVVLCIDRLGKGVYHINYTCRIDRPGEYFAGMAEIQAAYAPEFVAHSSGNTQLNIRE